MEVESLCKRIMKDLQQAFESEDPDNPFVEFDLILVPEKLENRSPVLLVENRIGLESWCVRYLYSYAYQKLIRWRQQSNKKSNGNVSLTPYSNDSDRTGNISEEQCLLQLTRILLLINPNLSICWCIRKVLTFEACTQTKELFQNQHLRLDDELRFSRLLIARKAKSPDNFYHRQWLIDQMSPDWLTYSRFLSELDVCRFACERYARNYYAWAYRSWLFDRKRDISIDFYHEDIYYLMGWIQQHISDYSAFHHLQNQILALFLLIRSGANANDPLSILDRLEQVLQQQFDSCNQLLRTFQAKESIHLHRRFLLQQLIQLRAMQSISTELALEELATKEVEFIEQQWKRCVQSDRPRTHALIKQHVRWLSRTFNVPIDCTELKTKFDCWND